MQNLFSTTHRAPWDLLTELEARHEHLDRLLATVSTDLRRLEEKERRNAANLAAFQRENEALRERAREKLIRPMVRAADGDTSTDAEAANRLIRREQVQKFVTAFEAAGARGLTDEEAHDVVGLQSHTPRVADMKRAGYLEVTGERRATKSGATARVYRLVKEWKGQSDGKAQSKDASTGTDSETGPGTPGND